MSQHANWKQIADIIRKKIETGEFACGQKLPREEDLATQFCVSRSTIHRALKSLETDGHVASRKRAGTIVTHKKRGQKHMVALIFDRVAHNFDFPASEMIEAIRETLGEQTGLVLCDSKDSIEREANFLTRMSKETDGIICFPIADQRDGQLLERVHTIGCPLVVVDRIPEGYAGSSVISDDREAIHQSIRVLKAKGHSKIGFVGFHKTTVSSAMGRYNAYIDAMQAEFGIDANPLVRWIGRDFETNGELLQTAIHDAILALIQPSSGITALICMQDDLGLRSMLVADELNLRVHEEFEIVTINEWPPLALKRPWDLHRIVRKKRAIGIAAAKLLQAQVANPLVAPQSIAIAADLITSSPFSAPELDEVQAWLNDSQKQEIIT